ncbi:hypothetical protein [Egicoccus sp. AB-alg2]|uniref:hypothetical protein n=1 Tax=Egicoccus sp. AB-alg2 TaxID=3242693 RepID=UPI00359F0A60
MNQSADTEGNRNLTAEVDLPSRATGMDLHSPAQRQTVEDAIATVPGIVGARIVPGYERPIDELHVLTTLQKQPKQAVRDIQTLLMARFGVSTDHRVISVVQLEELPRVVGGGVDRLVLERVATSITGGSLHVEVVLRLGDRELLGSGTGASTGAGRFRAPAEATLDAVSGLLGERTNLHLEGVDVVEALGRRLAITLIELKAGRYEASLTGCVLVREVDVDAIVRSVLDALNRTLDDPER